MNNAPNFELTEEFLFSLGFLKVTDHILRRYNYDIGRDRLISISDPGTCCEMMFLLEGPKDGSQPLEGVVVHNYDYDGPIPQQKVVDLISIFKPAEPIKA